MPYPDWQAARDDWLRTLAAQDAPLAADIKASYARTRIELERKLSIMQRQLEAAADNGTLTRAQVRRSEAWQRFNREMSRELETLEGALQRAVADGVASGAEAGLDAARRLAEGLARDPISFGWNRPDPKALRAFSDNLTRQLEQQIGLGKFANASGQKVADLLLSGMAQGYNPMATARLASQVFNVPLAWAQSHARTAQIYAYRAGTLEGYKANSDIVKGWIWAAALDRRTCPSCWSMHGTKHKHDETLNDHHQGRCCMIPDLGIPNVVNLEDGETAFRRLSPEDQRQVMGPTVWQGWKDGKVDFKAMSRTYDDPVYGTMRRAGSVKELMSGAGKAVQAPLTPQAGSMTQLFDAHALNDPTMRSAIDLMDKVHGVDWQGAKVTTAYLDKLPRNADGIFQKPPAPGAKSTIQILTSGYRKKSTFIHESGHAIEWNIFKGGAQTKTPSRELTNWWNSVSNSSTFDNLMQSRNGPLTSMERLELSYLTGKDELWARSYTQYIAVRTGDPELLSEIERTRSLDNVFFNSYWSDEDFEPIAAAFDDLFRARGWLR